MASDALLKNQPDLFDPDSIRALFDEMAATYGVVNLFTSFGFAILWRRWAVRRLSVRPDESVADFMCGRGELWSAIAERIGPAGSIIGIDLSSEMLRSSARVPCRLETHVGDVLDWNPGADLMGAVISSFGLKTLSKDQQRHLARQVARTLRPGGRFSFVEISVPTRNWIRAPYLLYLKRVIPIVGRLLLGNPDNYRMLGVYTQAFGDCSGFAIALREAGLEVNLESLLWGCATGVWGSKSTAS